MAMLMQERAFFPVPVVPLVIRPEITRLSDPDWQVYIPELEIEQSIREAEAFVVDGFPSPTLMPSFDDFTDDEITNLIAYLKTLQ
jgi:hypothetical protein